MRRFFLAAFCLLLVAVLLSPSSSSAQPAPTLVAHENVYAKQSDFSEDELGRFMVLLPKFRQWMVQSKEVAHPELIKNQADFVYSQAAADWVKAHGWDERRFFCVMGKAAAGLAIVAYGNEFATRPKDMPQVSQQELELIKKHLGELLKAGSSDAPPLKH